MEFGDEEMKIELCFSLSRQKWKLNLIEIKFEMMTRCDGQIDTDLCQYCLKIFEIKIFRKAVNWKFAVKEIGSIEMMESV